MGRARKPTAVKIMEGNRGRRPLPRNEPKPAMLGAAPQPPKHLTEDAREEWCRLAGDLAKLGLASNLDIAALTFYCEIYASWRDAIRVIAAEGAFYEVRGIKRKHPAQSQKEKCETLMRPYLGEFGMSPRSRAMLAAASAERGQPMLPMDLPQKEDPSKPKLPATPLDDLSDEEFLNVARSQ